jgi:hypothetical protein
MASALKAACGAVVNTTAIEANIAQRTIRNATARTMTFSFEKQ